MENHEIVASPIPDIQPDADERNDYGQVIAENVTFEDYMLRYAEHFSEWVDGVVIKMSPVHLIHVLITDYLGDMLKAYFTLKSVGKVIPSSYVMKLDKTRSAREPDLQILLNSNLGKLEKTMVRGAADICIEVVSPESVARDYGKKFEEYEKAGIPEYWLFDPLRQSTRFYRLDDKGIYVEQSLDVDGNYTTPLLPGFRLNVGTVWSDELPDVIQIVEHVKKMLAE